MNTHKGTSEDILTGNKEKIPAPELSVAKIVSYEPGSETDPVSEPNIYLEYFQQSILDQTKNYPLPVPVISIRQNAETIPFLTLKSFSLWQGKQKSKKTTALALAVAAFIRGSAFINDQVFVGEMDGVILFIDTEQGESYAARTMRLILSLADVQTSSKLIYCDLRSYSPADRMKIIKAGIETTPSIKIVVIDGIVDLLTDFMDAGEGHLTTTDILTLCSNYDIHIAGVLHQNKNDKNARAHIGTIASQKCEVEISTEVDNDDRSQSIVSCVNSRGIPFEPFAIRWDKGSLPCVSAGWNQSNATDIKSNKKLERSKEIAQSVFKPLTALTQTQAIDEVIACTMQSESTAKRLLKEWKIRKIIILGEDKHYRINSEGSKVH